jgi:hypothetical protein
MAKYNDITLKQNANTFRGLAGEIKLANGPSRSPRSAVFRPEPN